MKHKDLVSIIVPVYNAEKYLGNCIECILNQSYKNIELILVNDGSIDNSGLLCDKYARKDCRIRVIHQENSGPSVARNIGVDAALGEYIQFVDADDSVDVDMTSKLVEAMYNDVQLVLCGYKIVENNAEYIMIPSLKGIYQKNEFIKYFGETYKNGFINPLWNKLYKKDLIRKFDIQFIENLNMGEDLLFNLKYFNYCSEISIIQVPLYHYLLSNNNNSLTGSFKEDYFKNEQMLFDEIRKFLVENNNYYNENVDFVEEMYTDIIMNCFSNLFHIGSKGTIKSRRQEIKNIIDCCFERENMSYFKLGNLQKQIIGCLIKSKSINTIYSFFYIKSILRYKVNPLFKLLKQFNNG